MLTSGNVADTVNGDAGNDSLTNTAGNDTLTGGAGADSITLSGAGGALEDVVQNAGDGVACTTGFSAGTLAATNTIQFANGIDQVNTGFIAGGTAATSDKLSTGVAGLNVTFAQIVAMGQNMGALAAGNYAFNGNLAANGTFTIGDQVTNGAQNDDVLFFVHAGGDAQIASNISQAIVLLGSGENGTDILVSAASIAAAFIA